MRTTSNYKKVLKILEDLHKEYPSFNMGRHIATALDDYGDFWGISDKEFLFLLEKYKTTLDLDSKNIASEDYVDRIIEDSKNFDDILKEDYEED